MIYNYSKDNFDIILFPYQIKDRPIFVVPKTCTFVKNYEITQLINKTWQSAPFKSLKDSQTNEEVINDLLRFEGIKLFHDKINISVSATDYKIVYGTNIKNPHLFIDYGENYMGNALGICCYITTSDNMHVLLKRSSSVMELPNYYHLCAGHFDYFKKSNKKRFDLFYGIKNELREELSIQEDEILDIKMIGICRSKISYKPELLFSMKTKLKSDEIQKKQLNFEHNKLFVFSEKNMIQLLISSNHCFVPAAKANIICWLIHKYGLKHVQTLLKGD